MHHLSGTSKLYKVVYVALALALLVNVLQPALALAAPRSVAQTARAATSAAAPPVAVVKPQTTGSNCDLYPIALHTSSIAGKSAGDPIGDIYNGSAPGNFGWLSWTGDPSEPALVASLTPPGNSSTYIDPNNANNHTLSMGDWVDGKPGVSNSKGVRDALTQLESQDITVPVWDQAQGNGNTSQYHVVGFALIGITSFQLPGQNRISARYDGSTACGTPPPPPPGPSLSGDTLTLSPSVAGPDVTGTTQTLTATLKNRAGTPVQGINIQFTVSGANATTGGGTTNASGQTTLTYQGTSSGSDTIQASATSGGTTVQSNTASVSWVAPEQTVSTSTVYARFFPHNGGYYNEGFTATPSESPAFTQTFPTINFNPHAGTVPGNTSGVTSG
ncbi:MAG: Ig-like domain-containing protein, partial [Ktedonobacterales bacterium]